VDEKEEHAYSTWVTGESNHVWLPDSNNILFTRNREGIMNLAMVNIESGVVTDLNYLPKGEYTKLSASAIGTNIVACQFSNYNTRGQIFVINLDKKEIVYIIRSGLPFSDKDYKQIVKPEIITYPTSDGQQAHGFMYVRKKSNNQNEKIPCIFLIHGGPTGMHLDRFHYIPQYFASRGYAVFSVNYRGSIGYGRDYREILNGKWGYYDVEDTLDAYKYLTREKNIDPAKCAIMGGSAGGFTTLMFLIKHPGIMKAGINLFGVSDMFLLDEETHYLESHYTESLVGRLPEHSANYFKQSPVYHAYKIKDPLLILQGEIDEVVPKNQSEMIKEKIEMNKGTVEMKIYKAEGHGFKKFESIKDSLERTEKFLKMHVLYDK
jgi:dipeptidyl aminopeptidase/acylaminoacyl peptidase